MIRISLISFLFDIYDIDNFQFVEFGGWLIGEFDLIFSFSDCQTISRQCITTLISMIKTKYLLFISIPQN